jgi:dTDP-glucose 4,6-dehydratase
VHVTTPEVYGSTSGWIAEEAPINPSTPYAVSRAAGDMLMRIYQETFDLPVVMTRAANVYGAGQPLYRIIPRTVFYLLTGKTLQLHGGGTSSRSFIHIDDVCEATWRIASEAPVGEAYHISTDTVVTIRELVEMLCGMLGILFEEAVQSSPERPGKDEAYWLESDKIRQLGWTEQISLEEGAINVIEWVRRELPSLVQQPYDYVHKP